MPSHLYGTCVYQKHLSQMEWATILGFETRDVFHITLLHPPEKIDTSVVHISQNHFRTTETTFKNQHSTYIVKKSQSISSAIMEKMNEKVMSVSSSPISCVILLTHKYSLLQPTRTIPTPSLSLSPRRPQLKKTQSSLFRSGKTTCFFEPNVVKSSLVVLSAYLLSWPSFSEFWHLKTSSANLSSSNNNNNNRISTSLPVNVWHWSIGMFQVHPQTRIPRRRTSTMSGALNPGPS